MRRAWNSVKRITGLDLYWPIDGHYETCPCCGARRFVEDLHLDNGAER